VARGDRVRVLVRPSSDLSYLRRLPGVDVVLGDLGSTDALARAAEGMDVVYHSAARVSDFGSRDDFHDANVAGTQRLALAARAAGVRRFVFVSSPSVVMDDKDQLDIDESYPYPTRYYNLYSETKAEAERLVLAASSPSFLACAVRPRGVWGPRDRTGWLPKLVAKMMAGRLPNMSGGKPVYATICNAKNAAAACLLAARSDAVGGRAYFVTDGRAIDVWAFADVVAETLGIPKVRRHVDPRILRAAASVIDGVWSLPPLAKRYPPPLSRYAVALLTLSGTYSTAAAARDFAYAPVVSHDEGLAELTAWVQKIGGVRELVRHVT
jgi:nucleoside-diphosphate-sugar epimerase